MVGPRTSTAIVHHSNEDGNGSLDPMRPRAQTFTCGSSGERLWLGDPGAISSIRRPRRTIMEQRRDKLLNRRMMQETDTQVTHNNAVMMRRKLSDPKQPAEVLLQLQAVPSTRRFREITHPGLPARIVVLPDAPDIHRIRSRSFGASTTPTPKRRLNQLTNSTQSLLMEDSKAASTSDVTAAATSAADSNENLSASDLTAYYDNDADRCHDKRSETEVEKAQANQHLH